MLTLFHKYQKQKIWWDIWTRKCVIGLWGQESIWHLSRDDRLHNTVLTLESLPHFLWYVHLGHIKLIDMETYSFLNKSFNVFVCFFINYNFKSFYMDCNYILPLCFAHVSVRYSKRLNKTAHTSQSYYSVWWWGVISDNE